MFKPGTVFVVGAGASAELGMPFGDDFKTAISKKITFQFTDHLSNGLQSGDPLILQIFNDLGWNRGNIDIRDYLEQAWSISNALPMVSSIDSYIEMHHDNKKIELISKLSIVRTILEAERSSKLYYLPHNKNEFSLIPLTNTWLAKFVRLLTSRVPKSDIESIFDNISIICFNYDRCIEQFLALALEYAYLIKENEAREIVKKLRIYHPYGTVGDLPWQEKNQFEITFGKEINAQQLYEQTKKIKTYSEQTEEQETLNEIKNEVQNAQTLIFLGMAYHEQNLNLLMPDGKANTRRVFGTSLGISESNREIHKSELRRFLGDVGREMNHVYLQNLECSKFLDEYSKSIAQ